MKDEDRDDAAEESAAAPGASHEVPATIPQPIAMVQNINAPTAGHLPETTGTISMTTKKFSETVGSDQVTPSQSVSAVPSSGQQFIPLQSLPGHSAASPGHQLLFVTSPPHRGSESDGSGSGNQQMIHVYLVSPPGSPGIASLGSPRIGHRQLATSKLVNTPVSGAGDASPMVQHNIQSLAEKTVASPVAVTTPKSSTGTQLTMGTPVATTNLLVPAIPPPPPLAGSMNNPIEDLTTPQQAITGNQIQTDQSDFLQEIEISNHPMASTGSQVLGAKSESTTAVLENAEFITVEKEDGTIEILIDPKFESQGRDAGPNPDYEVINLEVFHGPSNT